MTVSALHHVALEVTRFDVSMNFYTRVLGLTIRHEWMRGESRRAMLEVGAGTFLEIFEAAPNAPSRDGRFVHLAFACPDLEATVQRVKEAGCEVTLEPAWITVAAVPPIVARNAFFKGPDGELLELFSA